MRTAHVLATLACLAPLAQDDEPSLEQEVAALLERTDALESFRLVYDMEGVIDGNKETGNIEFVYRAPDLGRLRVSNGSTDVDTWMIGDHGYMHFQEEWKHARRPEPPMLALLTEHFPPVGAQIATGVQFLTNAAVGKTGEINWDVSIGHQLGRTHVLGWLEDIREASGVTRESEAFVWKEEGVLRRISRRTGMLEELATESPRGSAWLRLQSAEIDLELDLTNELDELQAAAGEQPEDPAFAEVLSFSPESQRQLAFECAEAWLMREGHSLDDSSRANWRAVMDVLHRENLALVHVSIADDLHARIDERARRVDEELSQDASAKRKAEIEEKVRGSRTSLEGRLAEFLEKQKSLLHAIESLDQPALLEIEHEVIAELFAELVSGPILARHDEVMAAAFER